MVLWSRTAGYLTPFHPASELTLLAGPPLMPNVYLTSDANGHTTVPIGIANDANLLGFRVYFQAFSSEPVGFRGSNALELTICR